MFDVISDYISFTKEEAEVRKQALSFVLARYIRTSEAFFEKEGHLYGVLELFCEFFYNVLSMSQQLLSFSSFGLAPT